MMGIRKLLDFVFTNYELKLLDDILPHHHRYVNFTKKNLQCTFFLKILKLIFFHFFGRRTERLDDEVQAKQEEEQIG